VLLPLGNWLLMALSFWILMRRHGPVGLGEMTFLVGAAWLLNYLPLRPGLFGRVAYHKAINRIPFVKSIGATIAAIVCSGVAIVVLLGIAALLHGQLMGVVAAGGVTPLVLMLATAAVMPGTTRWMPLVLALRYADLVVWTGRYLAVFAIIDHPLSPAGAAAIACICQIALLVPLVGNGLGLREWAVGLAAGALPPGALTTVGTLGTTVGLAADLANRGAELVAAIPLGLMSAAVIARRAGGGTRSQNGRVPDSAP
jgi:hypothetical protein